MLGCGSETRGLSLLCHFRRRVGASRFLVSAVVSALAAACSNGGNDSGPTSAEAGPTCGFGGVYEVRFVNDGGDSFGGRACQGNYGGALTLKEGGSTLSSGGYFFASCAVTSSTTTCPSHISVSCTDSLNNGMPGLQSGATLEIDTDSKNAVTGTLTETFKAGFSCVDVFTGTRDPNG
jgi:hypothetical protein